MLQFEKTMARVLLLNAGLTMLVVFGFIGPPQQTNEFIVLLATGLLGVISAVLAMRGRVIGWWGGLIFYGLQLFSYYPYGDGWGYAVKAGVSFSVDFRFSHGVFLVNLIALLFALVTAFLLRHHVKEARAIPAARP